MVQIELMKQSKIESLKKKHRVKFVCDFNDCSQQSYVLKQPPPVSDASVLALYVHRNVYIIPVPQSDGSDGSTIRVETICNSRFDMVARLHEQLSDVQAVAREAAMHSLSVTLSRRTAQLARFNEFVSTRCDQLIATLLYHIKNMFTDGADRDDISKVVRDLSGTQDGLTPSKLKSWVIARVEEITYLETCIETWQKSLGEDFKVCFKPPQLTKELAAVGDIPTLQVSISTCQENGLVESIRVGRDSIIRIGEEALSRNAEVDAELFRVLKFVQYVHSTEQGLRVLLTDGPLVRTGSQPAISLTLYGPGGQVCPFFVPSPVTNVTPQLAKATNTLHVTWNAPFYGLKHVIEYRVCFSSTGGTEMKTCTVGKSENKATFVMFSESASRSGSFFVSVQPISTAGPCERVHSAEFKLSEALEVLKWPDEVPVLIESIKHPAFFLDPSQTKSVGSVHALNVALERTNGSSTWAGWRVIPMEHCVGMVLIKSTWLPDHVITVEGESVARNDGADRLSVNVQPTRQATPNSQMWIMNRVDRTKVTFESVSHRGMFLDAHEQWKSEGVTRHSVVMTRGNPQESWAQWSLRVRDAVPAELRVGNNIVLESAAYKGHFLGNAKLDDICCVTGSMNDLTMAWWRVEVQHEGEALVNINSYVMPSYKLCVTEERASGNVKGNILRLCSGDKAAASARWILHWIDEDYVVVESFSHRQRFLEVQDHRQSHDMWKVLLSEVPSTGPRALWKASVI